MSVRLDNFVKVNISRRIYAPNLDAFDTAVYVSQEQTVTPGYYAINGGSANADGTKEKPFAPISTDGYMAVFFGCGGKFLHVVYDLRNQQQTLSDGTTVSVLCYVNGQNDETLKELPLNEIVIFHDKDITPTVWGNSGTIGSGDDAVDYSYGGIYQKVWINSTVDTTTTVEQESGNVVKYTASATTDYIVATVAAYYTKINLNDERTIRDYAFTAENFLIDFDLGGTSIVEFTETNNTVASCMAANILVDTYLAGSIRNIGGNDLTGEDITNLVMRIILQQTVTNSLVTLLSSKIKLNMSGITSVKAAISNELLRYVANGYIDTEKVWQEDDLYIDNELVVTQNGTLPNGFAIHVSPISSDDVKNHRIPAIYILYGDSVGVRTIEITGEVF